MAPTPSSRRRFSGFDRREAPGRRYWWSPSSPRSLSVASSRLRRRGAGGRGREGFGDDGGRVRAGCRFSAACRPRSSSCGGGGSARRGARRPQRLRRPALVFRCPPHRGTGAVSQADGKTPARVPRSPVTDFADAVADQARPAARRRFGGRRPARTAAITVAAAPSHSLRLAATSASFPSCEVVTATLSRRDCRLDPDWLGPGRAPRPEGFGELRDRAEPLRAGLRRAPGRAPASTPSPKTHGHRHVRPICREIVLDVVGLEGIAARQHLVRHRRARTDPSRRRCPARAPRPARAPCTRRAANQSPTP